MQHFPTPARHRSSPRTSSTIAIKLYKASPLPGLISVHKRHKAPLEPLHEQRERYLLPRRFSLELLSVLSNRYHRPSSPEVCHGRILGGRVPSSTPDTVWDWVFRCYLVRLHLRLQWVQRRPLARPWTTYHRSDALLYNDHLSLEQTQRKVRIDSLNFRYFLSWRG